MKRLTCTTKTLALATIFASSMFSAPSFAWEELKCQATPSKACDLPPGMHLDVASVKGLAVSTNVTGSARATFYVSQAGIVIFANRYSTGRNIWFVEFNKGDGYIRGNAKVTSGIGSAYLGVRRLM